MWPWGWLALLLGTLGWAATRRRVLGPKPGDDEPTPSDPTLPPLDAFGVPFAAGSASPQWPLVDDRRSATPANAWARGRVTADFGDDRDGGKRRHAGEDLRAPQGSLVVATERGRIIGIDDDWGSASGHTAAVYVAFDTGIVANFGELTPGSTAGLGWRIGDVVEPGAPLGTIGSTRMLHFELYTEGTTHSHQWPASGPAPASLLDPTRYLERAAKTVPL